MIREEAIRRAALGWCAHDGLMSEDPSMGKDNITRRAWQNRQMEIEMVLDLLEAQGWRLREGEKP